MPPAVLLHDLGGDSSDWNRLAPELSPDWRAHAPDLRGHGDSEHSGPYTVGQFTADTEAFLDVLGMRRVVLIGHGLGAVPACFFAARHPDRVIRLVLEEPQPPFAPPADAPARPALAGSFDPEVLAVIEEFAGPPAEVRDLLGHITAPVLLIAGGPSSHVSQDQLAEMAGLIPDCELVTIPAGHSVHEAAPEEFAAAVTAFLGPAQS